MEALVWHVRTRFLNDSISCLANAREMNKMDSWQKRLELSAQLRQIERLDVIQAVDEVYDVADRNKWIHGLYVAFQDPSPDVSLWRANTMRERKGYLRFTRLHPDGSQFDEFHEALNALANIADTSLDFSCDRFSNYLSTLIGGDGTRSQSPRGDKSNR